MAQDEFENILLSLGQNISNTGKKVVNDISQCVNNYKSTPDIIVYSKKLAEILSEYTKCFEKFSLELEETVKEFKQEDVLVAVINILKNSKANDHGGTGKLLLENGNALDGNNIEAIDSDQETVVHCEDSDFDKETTANLSPNSSIESNTTVLNSTPTNELEKSIPFEITNKSHDESSKISDGELEVGKNNELHITENENVDITNKNVHNDKRIKSHDESANLKELESKDHEHSYSAVESSYNKKRTQKLSRSSNEEDKSTQEFDFEEIVSPQTEEFNGEQTCLNNKAQLEIDKNISESEGSDIMLSVQHKRVPELLSSTEENTSSDNPTSPSSVIENQSNNVDQSKVQVTDTDVNINKATIVESLTDHHQNQSESEDMPTFKKKNICTISSLHGESDDHSTPLSETDSLEILLSNTEELETMTASNINDIKSTSKENKTSIVDDDDDDKSTLCSEKDSVDFDVSTDEIESASEKDSKESEEQLSEVLIREDELINKSTSSEEESTEDTSEPKAHSVGDEETHSSKVDEFLDENGRDELLGMLTNDNKNQEAKIEDKEKSGELKLDEKGRDELLEMLTNDNKKEEPKIEDKEKSPELKLDEKGRDELLGMLTNDEEKEYVSDEFCLNSEGRDELLNMLTIDETKKGDLNDQKEEKHGFNLNEQSRTELLDMLSSNYEKSEQSQVYKMVESSSKEEEIEENSNLHIKDDMLSSVDEKDRPSEDLAEILSNVDDDQESDSETELYELLREEEVIDNESKSKRVGSKKAREAYQSLLDDSDITLDSEDESFDDFNSQWISGHKNEKDQALRKKFGINKELEVHIEEIDFEEFDRDLLWDVRRLSERHSSGKLDTVESLCDLSTVLRTKRKIIEGNNRFMLKRMRTESSSSSSISSNERNSDSSSDRTESLLSQGSSSSSDTDVEDGLSRKSLTLSPQRDSKDDQAALATSLWDDINNSSDEALSDNKLGTGDELSDSDIEAKPKRLPKRSTRSQRSIKDRSSSDGEDEDKEKSKQQSIWRRDPLLRGQVTTDSDSDGSVGSVKRQRKKIRLKLSESSGSDADFKPTEHVSSHSDSDQEKNEDNDSNDAKNEEQETSSSSSSNEDEEIIEIKDSPEKAGKGRRNIRALVDDRDLSQSTQLAQEEEEARIKRLQEKQKVRSSMSQSQTFSNDLMDTDDIEHLVLDEDIEEESQIKVHHSITKQLKPHQRDGIQFMWDSCYESIKQLKKGWQGSGCILAHCMGLGKTRQALGLIHTVLANKVTKSKHVLIVCPLSTVNNWKQEFKLTLGTIKSKPVNFFSIQGQKVPSERFAVVGKWRMQGGILALGYEAFMNLTSDVKLENLESKGFSGRKSVLEALVDPGPDLVICDEGHLLRNKQSQRTHALNKIKTKRRIVLTGTPLQNNLLEYYCMVHFVKPNLLGTEQEYKTNFVNPITNGQFEDSTSSDILLMKKRTHVLHKLLDSTVQRLEDTELKQYLPKLVDQALIVGLSVSQVGLYNTYLDTAIAMQQVRTSSGKLNRKNFLADVAILDYVCSHPYALCVAAKIREKKVKEEDVVVENGPDDVVTKYDWWKDKMPDDLTESPGLGTKMLIILDILEQTKIEGDKVLIFSQTHAEMSVLEHFLGLKLGFKKNLDYMRMDGSSQPEKRTDMCAKFNDLNNKRLRLLIMSTKVGGLGLNLTAANRVIITSVNWNPSYDVQSVFRVFRFGQTKEVFVYRLIAMDTMEERRYKRQVNKLAIAHRVVDKHQVKRLYNMHDIQEFYSVRPEVLNDRPLPNVPEDKILGKLIQKFPFLYKWHEHRQLLANQPEEHLNEQQKNAAWEEFNRKDEPPPPPPVVPFKYPRAFPQVPGHIVDGIPQPGHSGALHINQFTQSPPTPAKAHFDHNYSLPLTGVANVRAVQIRIPSEDDFYPIIPHLKLRSPGSNRMFHIVKLRNIKTYSRVKQQLPVKTFDPKLNANHILSSSSAPSTSKVADVSNTKTTPQRQGQGVFRTNPSSVNTFSINTTDKPKPVGNKTLKENTTRQSLLQARMRDYMKHLHLLQQQSSNKNKESSALRPNPHAIINKIGLPNQVKPQVILKEAQKTLSQEALKKEMVTGKQKMKPTNFRNITILPVNSRIIVQGAPSSSKVSNKENRSSMSVNEALKSVSQAATTNLMRNLVQKGVSVRAINNTDVVHLN
ncbi:transcriptional regulator ATRX-like isoform X3 [Sitophilus oryzae]|uniref:Transcriptional regulator ATRX-like isoform X3 n=1 Tax=Sitophilus oryzae TaxID=7048 RepID=A0A6J2XH78_SITOR|nr:transcriptional regulator ATRX-like isoform X3 [Sitophilus oryzae]